MDAALSAVGGVGFLIAFVLGAAFGLSLLRRPDVPAGAVCLSSIAVLIPLTILMGVLHSPWGHIAYSETALFVGIALLARHPQPVELRQPVAQT